MPTNERQALERFRQILQLETVWSRTDSDIRHDAFVQFLPLLQVLYPRVFSSLEYERIGSYGVLLMWRGKDRDLKPVILTGHHDVVAADASEWEHPPFAADIADGSVWARGSVDTKCIIIGILEAFDALLEEGFQPPRDLYFYSTYNEEIGGDGTPVFITWLQERGLTPAFVLDEGGALIDKAPLGVNAPFAMVGVTEKGGMDLLIRARSSGGHSSQPSAQDAPQRLVKALNRIENNPAKAQLSPVVSQMIRILGKHSSSGLIRFATKNLGLFKPLIISFMEKSSETAAMLRTTRALTQLQGSKAINILPEQAYAGFSVRVASFDSLANAKEEIGRFLEDEMELEVLYESEPCPVSPFTNDKIFSIITESITQTYPEAIVAPYALNGGSDARHFSRICNHVYRFAGFIFTAEERAHIHGPNERLSLESFTRGLQFYRNLIKHLDDLEV